MGNDLLQKIHGRKISSTMLAHQGASKFFSSPSQFPAQNPLTKTGGKVMESMQKQYGKRAKEVFYASINKKVSGSSKWHK